MTALVAGFGQVGSCLIAVGLMMLVLELSKLSMQFCQLKDVKTAHPNKVILLAIYKDVPVQMTVKSVLFLSAWFVILKVPNRPNVVVVTKFNSDPGEFRKLYQLVLRQNSFQAASAALDL